MDRSLRDLHPERFIASTDLARLLTVLGLDDTHANAEAAEKILTSIKASAGQVVIADGSAGASAGLSLLGLQRRHSILRATAKSPRDHLIISMALGTGLRLGEIVGLNVGDVLAPDGAPRVRVHVRREIAKGPRVGDVFLPDKLIPKLARFWKWKKRRGENLDPTAPLFCAQSGRRLSRRRVQFAWRTWQHRAGFDRLYPFHCLRHSAVTAVYRQTRDLFLAQRFARHLSPLTTTVYTHPSDEEIWFEIRGLHC